MKAVIELDLYQGLYADEKGDVVMSAVVWIGSTDDPTGEVEVTFDQAIRKLVLDNIIPGGEATKAHKKHLQKVLTEMKKVIIKHTDFVDELPTRKVSK